MKNREKEILEKLMKLLHLQSECCRVVSKSFADSKKYHTAEDYLTEARAYEYVSMVLEHEDFLDSQLAIYDKDEGK